MKKFVSTIIATAFAFSAAFAGPANDDFANREVLEGTYTSVSGTLAGATFEANETSYLSYPGSGGSVWWTWTAPASSQVIIEMQRDFSQVDSSNSLLQVFTGDDLSALTLLDENTFDAPAGRYVAFEATEGVGYQFRVAGGWNGPFSLVLIATNPPVFVSQPKDTVVSPYGSAFFSAMATGPGPRKNYFRDPSASYQWKFNGSPIFGQTAPSLVVTNVTTNEVGSYSVVASNAGGMTESSAAMLSLEDTNPVPSVLAQRPVDAAHVSTFVTGEQGRWYRIESSQDLTNWDDPIWFEATNSTNFITVARLGPDHFIRAALNVPTDTCIAQLQQMRWALSVFAVEDGLPFDMDYTLEELKAYLPLTVYSSIQACPEGGFYVTGDTIMDPVTCSLANRGHVLPSQ
ncbi:MAG TPA: hypothetical protein VHH88_02425 [Verrucomicrobiae bacterium]|nr:hypothetical protein [Verrucomicrobiae bacterium]